MTPKTKNLSQVPTRTLKTWVRHNDERIKEHLRNVEELREDAKAWKEELDKREDDS